MEDIEISFNPYTSGDIYRVSAIAVVEEYVREDDDSENVVYTLEDIEVEREDGSVVELDEEELESLLSKHDWIKIETLVLEDVRYSL